MGLKPGGVFLLAGLLLAGCVAPVEDNDAVEWGADPVPVKEAYQQAMDFLDSGRQADAEAALIRAGTEYPDTQRLLFLYGVLLRSRFEMDSACGALAAAYKLDSENVLGRAANIVVAMDFGENAEQGFRTLAKLIEANPEEALLRWLYVIEAVSRKQQGEEAIRQCEWLNAHWKVAPVTLNKAYANLLIVVKKDPETALDYRWKAAEQEPIPRNYEGIARTLEMMKRYEEAEAVYAKMAELAPDEAIRWFQWGNCLAYLQDYAGADEKFEKAAGLDEDEVISLLCWGRCLERLGRPEEGFEKYLEAIRRKPLDYQAAAYVALGALYGYGTECNFEAALKASANQGKPAVETLRERVMQADRSRNPLAPAHTDQLLKHLIALAEGGNPEAQYSLCMIYENGIGVDPNPEKAQHWLQQAAGNGHAIAQRMLNPPVQSTDAVASVKPENGDAAIQGMWTSEQSVAVYEIENMDGKLQVRGYSSYSGKEMLIHDVQWNGTVLRFTSYMPSTDRKVVHENRLLDDETMVSTIVGHEGSVTWKKKKAE